jgi:protocadherin Fat 1/2/3
MGNVDFLVINSFIITFFNLEGKTPLHAETTVNVKVMDRLMPVFDRQFFNATVPENAEPYTAILSVVAESPQGRKLIYGISRGNEYEEFGFDFNTGED